MKPKPLIPILLITLLISVFFLASITPFSLAQTSYEISGYILDSNGQGVASAMIIFNVPDIVPAVYSDSSGYYMISAPADTYHINVWPPYDSNYLSYDEKLFVVESDTTKNITLNSGYKVSGYVTDSSGNPVRNGLVFLDTYFSGWFYNYLGYYFVSAPEGTYSLIARPRAGYDHFPIYTEYNFIVDGNIEKNITVGGTSLPTPSPSPTTTPPPIPTITPQPSPTPNPTPSPNPTRSQITISADASSSLVGSAVNVNGKLVSTTGSVLNDETVILSFAVGNTDSWIPIGSDITNDAGKYNIQWINDASGAFTLKVEWRGDVGYQDTLNTTSLSFLPYNSQNLFHVESNSTVSALAFNSTSLDLSFTVSGSDGTKGYVKTTIAKDLVSDVENIKVYLDGNQLNYKVTSQADSWVLFFTYAHSTHQVSINLAENSEGTILSIDYLTWIVPIVIIVVIGISLLVYFKKYRK